MPTNSVESLDIFPDYPDRSTYQNVLGTQAPVFDPSVGFIKEWQDPAAAALPPTAVMTYTKLNTDINNPALVTFTVPAGVAARVNLPGKPAYAKYFIQPTDATGSFMVGFSRQTVAVQPNTLSLKPQADALAALVGATVVDRAIGNTFVTYNFPADEPRREWMLTYKNGLTAFAGDLLAGQWANGIGAPGHWDTTGNVLAWVADPIPDGTDKAYAKLDIPKRPLNSDEKLVVVSQGSLGAKAVAVQQGPDATPPATGENAALLNQLVAQVGFIYNLMGGK